LYTANSAVNLATLIPNYDMNTLKDKLQFLSSANIENFDFLNLTYYIELCNNLNISVNFSALNDKISKYYDKDSNLFFIDSENDTINIKIIATSIVKKAFKENLSEELFSFEKGVKEAYDNYTFLTENDITLFNSGGDILYCLAVFGMTEIVDKVKLADWYEYWKSTYESISVDSDISALQYAEFLNIANIFQSDYTTQKLQNYYNKLDEENLESSEDLYVLYNIIKGVPTLNNANANNLLKDKISDVIGSESFVNSDIDVKATAFGVMLAQKTEYPLNKEKIKKYVKQNYLKDFSSENAYDRASFIYYNLILDQLINGYEQDYNVSYFQSQIDDLLKIIDYDSQSIAGDVVATRRIVEIISDLRIFDVDIKLTVSQKSKIKKGFKAALENTTLKNSVLLNDVYIVNKILSLNIVSEEELVSAYNVLTTNGGTYSAKQSEITPDIISTYQFFASLNRMNIFDYLSEQKMFVETLKSQDGIYALDTDNVSIDLVTIVYGNAINSFKIGGDKGA
jgi:hypothetical protein